jgi:hypothetical protein
VPYRQRDGTTATPPDPTRHTPAPHPHSSGPRRSAPRTLAQDPCVPAAAPESASLPARSTPLPIPVVVPSKAPPSSRCCVHRLNLVSTPPGSSRDSPAAMMWPNR